METMDLIFRTHLTKQDSKELRVGKERVGSLDDINDTDNDADSYAEGDGDDDGGGGEEGGDDDDGGSGEGDDDDDGGGAGEGGGARGGCGVWLPLCGNFSKPLQRTF